MKISNRNFITLRQNKIKTRIIIQTNHKIRPRLTPIEGNISNNIQDYFPDHSGKNIPILRLNNKAQLDIYDYQYIPPGGPLEKSYNNIGLTSDQVVSNISETDGSQVSVSCDKPGHEQEINSREPTSHNKTRKENCDQNNVKPSVIRAADILLRMKKGFHLKIPTARIIWVRNPVMTSSPRKISTLDLSKSSGKTSESSITHRETSLYKQSHETWIGTQRRFRRNSKYRRRNPRKRFFGN